MIEASPTRNHPSLLPNHLDVKVESGLVKEPRRLTIDLESYSNIGKTVLAFKKKKNSEPALVSFELPNAAMVIETSDSLTNGAF